MSSSAGAELEGDRGGRLQWRRPCRHPMAERRWSGLDLGDGREHQDRRQGRRRRSRAELGRRPGQQFNGDGLRTSCGKTPAPAGLDLGNGREHAHQRAAPRRRSRADWKAIGTGDFNRDGFPTSFGRTRAPARSRSGRWREHKDWRRGDEPCSGPDWQAIGTGDFTATAFPTILFQNTSTRPGLDLGDGWEQRLAAGR